MTGSLDHRDGLERDYDERLIFSPSAGRQAPLGVCHGPKECVLRPIGWSYRGNQCLGLRRAGNCARTFGHDRLTEDLIDTGTESGDAIAALKYTPGAAFGSCRYKLASLQEHRAQYERLIEVFRAHDIAYFFYNGGGDS
jgi:hypothetical protein